MTEDEWLVCEDSRPMAKFLKDNPRLSARTRRLFMAAFWITQLPHINADNHREFRGVIAALERWADSGRRPRKHHTNVFMDRDAVEAWDRTLGVAGHTHSGFGTAAPRQAVALREVFGNPFRPVVCDPEWLTTDVIALANGIYKEKAFDRMPILADALQDAGCANEDVLNHLRDANATHVRGCWALDLVLGK